MTPWALDPRILVILILFSAGYYVGEQAVAGIKAVDKKIVHVVKDAGHKVGHALKKVVGH